jgi:hypothetical protein
MGKFPLKRRLSPDERRALELLASNPNGATEELLVGGHGFTRRMLTGLVDAGLAIARREVIKAGARAIEVNRIMITDAGRRAIEG